MLGYFKALSERGITPNLKAFEEYDFSRPDYTGQTIILAHQIAVPLSYVPLLESFVRKGGKLIVDGMTGFYDGDVHNQMLTGFSLKNLFGGCISEFKRIDTPCLYRLKGYEQPLPGYGWKGLIRPDKGAETLSRGGELSLASRLPLEKERWSGFRDCWVAVLGKEMVLRLPGGFAGNAILIVCLILSKPIIETSL